MESLGEDTLTPRFLLEEIHRHVSPETSVHVTNVSQQQTPATSTQSVRGKKTVATVKRSPKRSADGSITSYLRKRPSLMQVAVLNDMSKGMNPDEYTPRGLLQSLIPDSSTAGQTPVGGSDTYSDLPLETPGESLVTPRESLAAPRESLATPRENLATPREDVESASTSKKETMEAATKSPELQPPSPKRLQFRRKTTLNQEAFSRGIFERIEAMKRLSTAPESSHVVPGAADAEPSGHFSPTDGSKTDEGLTEDKNGSANESEGVTPNIGNVVARPDSRVSTLQAGANNSASNDLVPDIANTDDVNVQIMLIPGKLNKTAPSSYIVDQQSFVDSSEVHNRSVPVMLPSKRRASRAEGTIVSQINTRRSVESGTKRRLSSDVSRESGGNSLGEAKSSAPPRLSRSIGLAQSERMSDVSQKSEPAQGSSVSKRSNVVLTSADAQESDHLSSAALSRSSAPQETATVSRSDVAQGATTVSRSDAAQRSTRRLTAETAERSNSFEGRDSLQKSNISQSLDSVQVMRSKLRFSSKGSNARERSSVQTLSDEDSAAGYDTLHTPVVTPNAVTPATSNKISDAPAIGSLPAGSARKTAPKLKTSTGKRGKNLKAVKTKSRRPQLQQSPQEEEPSRLPRKVTRDLFKLYCGMNVTESALFETELVCDNFWKNLFKDVNRYAAHAGRQTIEVADLELLLKRRRMITSNESLQSLAEKHLPLEYREQLFPAIKAVDTLQ